MIWLTHGLVSPEPVRLTFLFSSLHDQALGLPGCDWPCLGLPVAPERNPLSPQSTQLLPTAFPYPPESCVLPISWAQLSERLLQICISLTKLPSNPNHSANNINLFLFASVSPARSSRSNTHSFVCSLPIVFPNISILLSLGLIVPTPSPPHPHHLLCSNLTTQV